MRLDALKPGDVFAYLGAEAELISFGLPPVHEVNVRNSEKLALGEDIGWLRLRYLAQGAQGEREWPERGDAEVVVREVRNETEHNVEAGHGDRHLLEDAAKPVSRAALPESSADGDRGVRG